MIEVLASGPYATVQDLGRPGYGHLGVPRSGAADAPSLRLANRLVGNPEGAAGIELTFGGCHLGFSAGAWVAVTGAPCPVELLVPGSAPRRLPGPAGPRPDPGAEHLRNTRAGMCAPFWVPAGGRVRLGTPTAGLRTYLAVRGGVDVPPVLGSRSTDSLSGLGPAPLAPGRLLPVGPALTLPQITVDAAPPRPVTSRVLRVLPGPRDDWFAPGATAALCAGPYEVSQDSNRVGVRLRGAALERVRGGELPSEGVVAGALQVPPDGQPIVFLADHPPTGGYPVIAVLTPADLPRAAQLRPGDTVRFRL
ncbi:biotin-dependent carboxyltransferase family protein [Planomonospora sp. ID67723]|uniref:5-oxoprolinase subunit C family protein n=1 Tax=Planomonospora sp. ID67723 TaxID=2738134 RepID=UPI0018C3BDE2|nr:biotin-dependent carboxyltransferase family protein [Planomonospora sp. ID67723]MBG0830593.1 biotin-dependent carboxyltransferase family protein [Planomonospora sp. ID67723]